MGTVRITVDGKVALTTAQFAAECGISVPTARTTIARLGIEPVGAVDGRTALYPATELRRAYRARPGRGSNLRRGQSPRT